MTDVHVHTAESDLDIDADDGAPVSGYQPGASLPGGVLAWERLGVGHRCETWLAWSPALWCPVVVKFPRPHQLMHSRARRSLVREVVALGGNPHPGLPGLYVDGTYGEVPHVVFEHVDGVALDDEIDEHGAFDPLDVALLGAHLLAAMRAVHARGLVHIDIKSANVMLRAGRPVLLDFGSARTVGALQPLGKLIGSAGYAAPELEAGAPIDFSMDVYGLGVVLHEALAGDVTFEPELPALERPAPPALPASEVASIVLAMLDPDPAGRPGVEAALRAFGTIAAAGGRPARPAWLAV